MNRFTQFAFVSCLVLGLSGCSLLSPGNKEFFQKKVPVYPEKPKLEETQRQAAVYLADRVGVAYDAGLRDQVTNSVMTPLLEARTVATPLASSLGAPEKKYDGSSTNLANQLTKFEAKYEDSLRKLETKLDDLQGKKIEGTGLIQVGYFSYVLIIAAVLGLLWFILKIVGIFNPPVALGMQEVSAGAGLVRRGFSEVVDAGEKFKDAVKAKVEDPALQAHVLELFRNAHMQAQSRDVQQVVKLLTEDPNDPTTLAKALKSV